MSHEDLLVLRARTSANRAARASGLRLSDSLRRKPAGRITAKNEQKQYSCRRGGLSVRRVTDF